jgi:hypothetical protein
MSEPVRYPAGTFRHAHSAENRALDVEVAVRLRGKRFGVGDGGAMILLRGGDDLAPAAPLAPDWDQYLAAYSTDIGHAWAVVEEMRERRFGVVLRSPDGPQPGHDVWRCEFTNLLAGRVGNEPDATVGSPSLPEAICRAALAAVAREEVAS